MNEPSHGPAGENDSTTSGPQSPPTTSKKTGGPQRCVVILAIVLAGIVSFWRPWERPAPGPPSAAPAPISSPPELKALAPDPGAKAKTGWVHELVTSFNIRPRSPGGRLVLGPDGDYWGTSMSGGAYNMGTVYKVKGDGSSWQTVLSFSGDGLRNRGACPEVGLLNDGTGSFWGTTKKGGANDFGTIFKLNAVTGALTTMVEFTGESGINKGTAPRSALVSDGAGSFWGTTEKGGAHDRGTVYKLNATTGVLTTQVEFPLNGAKKGAFPNGALVSDGAGSFLGTTFVSPSGIGGTIFKVNAKTGDLTTLIDFAEPRSSGAQPYSGLVNDGDGFFWGTTGSGGKQGYASGGKGWGTVFKINAKTGALTTVVEFSGFDRSNTGREPRAELVSDGAGFLWGTTVEGGANNCGTVFKVNASTGALTTVVEFAGDSKINMGSSPLGALVSDGAGSFWGTSSEVDLHNDAGTVFKVNANNGALTTLVQFSDKGQIPRTRLVSDGAGFLWGTTVEGGANNCGTIFKVNPRTGALITVVDFDGTVTRQGRAPSAALVSDGTGFLWGLSLRGGVNENGTIFKVNVSSGMFSTVVYFTGKQDGNRGGLPKGSLVSDRRGFLWGSTSAPGTIFKVSASSGLLTTVVDFPSLGASNPGLVADDAGSFWGTNSEGGSFQKGSIFKVNPNTGEITTMVEFYDDGEHNKGKEPQGDLVSDGHGSFWGATASGGVNGFGTVFKVNATTGALTTLVEFTKNGASNKGAHPDSALVNDGFGSFWGTTSAGGATDNGTVFKVDASTGVLTTPVEFTGIGSQPLCGSRPHSLFRHTDGAFYGKTLAGGPDGGGTIFRLRLSQPR